MAWLTIIELIISAIAGGALTGIVTIHETRKGMKIDNRAKEQDQHIRLIDELQDQNEKLNDRLEQKDGRILELEDENASLHIKLNNVSTDRAICKILRCDKIACSDRVPPLGLEEIGVDKSAYIEDANE